VQRIEEGGEPLPRVLVLEEDAWHPGVIGIVASRLVERYHRPAILIGRSHGMGRGSGRSIPGFSLYDALTACAGELESFGGHKMAAGLRIAWERIPVLRKRINEHAAVHLAESDLVPGLRADAVLGAEDVSPDLVEELERLSPFGLGNPEPLFLLPRVHVEEVRVVGRGHLRFRMAGTGRPLWAVGFDMGPLLEEVRRSPSLDLLVHLRFNDFNGDRRPQAVVADIRSSSP